MIGLSRRTMMFVTILLGLSLPTDEVGAQYFTKDVTVSKGLAAKLQEAAKVAKFDDTKTFKKKFSGYDEVRIIPAARDKGVRLKELGDGFLVGKWPVNENLLLGTKGKALLKPGEYYLWLAREAGIWLVIATDPEGRVKGFTKEVTLHMDENDEGEFFSQMKVGMFKPPYVPVGEGGVNCDVIWTTIDDPHSGERGRTTCWPFRWCHRTR